MLRLLWGIPAVLPLAAIMLILTAVAMPEDFPLPLLFGLLLVGVGFLAFISWMAYLIHMIVNVRMGSLRRVIYLCAMFLCGHLAMPVYFVKEIVLVDF